MRSRRSPAGWQHRSEPNLLASQVDGLRRRRQCVVGTPSYVSFAGLSFSTAVGAGYDFNLYDNGGGNYAILSQFINASGNPADGGPRST